MRADLTIPAPPGFNPAAPAPAPALGVTTVPPAQVAGLQAAGKARDFIDVRTPGEFAAIHAQGARLVPLDRLEAAAVQAARLAPDQSVFLICKSGVRAGKAAQLLAAAGLPVVCVEGGTDAWAAAGLPVVRGKGVIALERQVRIAAGTLVVTGVALGFLIHPALFALSAFVGAGLVFAGITDTCGLGMLLARMPWNQCQPSSGRPCCATSKKV